MSTPVHAVATPLKTCRASCACRAYREERVAPCCLTSATHYVTTYTCAKMHGLDIVLRNWSLMRWLVDCDLLSNDTFSTMWPHRAFKFTRLLRSQYQLKNSPIRGQYIFDNITIMCQSCELL